MDEITASRTLVKSPPELWSECSEAGSLARHLGQFGEIRITRLEPETAVAWEGEEFSGTVRLEPAGWGTRVIITAQSADGEPEPDAEDDAPKLELTPRARPGLLARLRSMLGLAPPRAVFARRPDGPRGVAEPEAPEPALGQPPEPPPEHRLLLDALESLGTAHHRPFSRG